MPGPIPQLEGESNIEEWAASIRNYFRWNSIEKYLTTNVTPPPNPTSTSAIMRAHYIQWQRDMSNGRVVISNSLLNKNVQGRLRSAGWTREDKDITPKDLFDLVLKVISNTHETAFSSLVLEFCTLERAKYQSLEAFQTRVTFLKGRLEELKGSPPEKANMVLVIDALKMTYPEWYSSLIYEFDKGRLTWNKLMEEISKRASDERSVMGLWKRKRANS